MRTSMFVLIVAIGFLIFLSWFITENRYSHKDLESHRFNITFIDQHGGFYGDSNDGKGLYFTSDKLIEHTHLSIGDSVTAWFPESNLENVIKVKKTNN